MVVCGRVMATRLKKHLDELRVLKKSKPAFRKSILRAADKDLICCLCECSHNVLNGNIKLSPKDKKPLQKHSKHLRELASRNISLKKKRGILVQKGGFLPALLGPILAIAASVIPSLINK